jgi:lipid-binding SYLF domain-containing protein
MRRESRAGRKGDAMIKHIRITRNIRLLTSAFILATTIAALTAPPPALAESAAGLEEDADAALRKLYEQSPSAKLLGEHAKAILVFPNIYKAGFIVGGQYGEGVLFKRGKVVGFYNSVAASYGLQAGVEGFAYALFLMKDSAVRYLDKSDGWEIGVGPNVVVVDEGFAKSLTTTTMKDDVYAFIFSQKGLMAGIGIQGSKITRIHK